VLRFVFFTIFFSVALQVRVQAIRGLPLFCKDTPENIGKMVDILVQILGSGKLVVVYYDIGFFENMVFILIYFLFLILFS
jgi:hypothetical protein